MGSWKKKTVKTADDWRDTPPDLTTGEHDMLVATLEQAWHDVRLDPDSVPAKRREEAVAIQVSAYEWFTQSDEFYAKLGLTRPRLSFATVCLHLELNPDNVRAVVLHGIEPPEDHVPDRWRKLFTGPDDPERHRDDRGWTKHKPSEPCPECPELDAPEKGSGLLHVLLADTATDVDPLQVWLDAADEVEKDRR